MKFKHLGCDIVPACTLMPATSLFDMRSCRERTGCTKECIPKILQCPRCGKMDNMLEYLENVETGEKITVCYDCMKELEKD